MNIVGIVAEYNPIHNGHLHHLEETKRRSKADFVVVVMSGPFSQRGEATVTDKWTRAKWATLSGADLVLELPFAFACNSAEYFAKGAMEIFQGIGCITHISFGSESGNIDSLKELANHLKEEEPAFKKELKRHLDKGYSFPKSRELAVNTLYGEDLSKLLTLPNNILAIEYLKHMGDMKPLTVKRKGSYHEASVDVPFISATAARKQIEEDGIEKLYEKIPTYAYEDVKANLDHLPVNDREMTMIKAIIIRNSLSELKNIFACSEGMENKMKKVLRYSSNKEELVGNLKSKRYTQTGIQRLLMQTLVGLKKEDLFKNNLYARVLAFNEKGQALLRKVKRENLSTIPIVTNVKGSEGISLLDYDVLATDLYNIITERDSYEFCDYVKKPIKI